MLMPINKLQCVNCFFINKQANTFISFWRCRYRGVYKKIALNEIFIDINWRFPFKISQPFLSFLHFFFFLPRNTYKICEWMEEVSEWVNEWERFTNIINEMCHWTAFLHYFIKLCNMWWMCECGEVKFKFLK